MARNDASADIEAEAGSLSRAILQAMEGFKDPAALV